MPSRILLLLLVAATTVSLAADTPVSPVRFGPSASPFRFAPAIASGPHGFLVAWEERVMQLYAGTSRISFRALDADGKPRKPAATTLDAGMQPSAVANDDGYLLVWMTQPSRFAVGDPPQPIFATKIGPEGSVQRQTRFDVPLSAGSGAHVAWNGRQYLIVTPRVALLIDSDLNLIRSINISVLGYCVDVSSADGQFLIASVTSDALKVAVISASGALGDPLTLGPRPFSAATSGSSIAWSDAAGVHAARLGADGIVADRVELQTGVSATGVGIGGDVASWFPYVPGPSNPTVSICTARIRVDPQTTCSPYAFAARGAAVAQSASTNVLAWIDGAGSTEDIRLDVTPRPVLPLPQATDPILSVAAQAQTSPVIERAPEGGSLVAWSEYNSAVRRTEIRMADIAADGTVRREWPVAASSRDQFGPAISPAADGDILVVWSEGSQFDAALRGAIVTTNSDRATVIEIGTGMAPSVAFNGGEWLVVWQTKPWGYNGSVRSSIVDHSGVWTPGGLPIAPDGSSQTEPAVVWSGRSFAVVWRETEPTGDSILFTTISTTNTPSTPQTIGTKGGFYLRSPSVAASNDRLLVTWAAQYGGGSGHDLLLGALFDSAGTRIDRGGGIILLSPARDVTFCRVRPVPNGFIVIGGGAVLSVDLSGDVTRIVPAVAQGNFTADRDGITIAYARPTTAAEEIGAAMRVFLARQELGRRRSVRMR